MKQVDEPRVFLVGITKTVPEGIQAYLNSINNPEWTPDENVSEGENLAEMAGRMCYRSWQPYDENNKEGTNKNVKSVRHGNKQYIGNVIDSGHGSVLEHINMSFIIKDISRVFCYHPDTEVFTNDSWKKITDLADDEILLTKDPSTGICRWSKNKKLHEFDYTGDLISASTNQTIMPPVTPEHLLWCSKYDLRMFRGMNIKDILHNGFFNKIPANEVFGKRIVLDLEVPMVSDNNQWDKYITIGDYDYPVIPLFTWLGWMATDGSTSAALNGRSRCRIDQSKPQNIYHIREIMNILFKDRWKENGPYNNNNISFNISDPELQQFVITHLGPNKKERKFSEFILNAPTICLSVFYYAALMGDGNIHNENHHEVLYMPSYVAAGQWQFILARIGKAGNIRFDYRYGDDHELNGKVVRNNTVQCVVSVSQKSAMLLKKDHWIKIPYHGKVYCPQTDDGLIFVRYGSGLPMWSGNTHELVRHRAGMAYSQESLRYVRLDELKFWIPDLLKEKSEDYIYHVVEYLEQIQSQLQKEYDIDNITDFTMKKMLTSAFRRVAPIGLATSIFVTGNVRSWRHILEMRSSIHAEEEIRLVAHKIGIICKKEFPNFFQDMELNNNNEWTFKKSKV